MKGERLGELEEVVLLAAGGLGANASAVSVQRTLRERVDRKVTMGALYAALDRLERKGFLASEVRDSKVEGERRKRFYELTDDGLDALGESRQVREALWRQLPSADGATGGQG